MDILTSLKLQEITEARKSIFTKRLPLIVKLNILKDDPKIHIHFSSVNKIGVNPQFRWKNPQGTYAYPLGICWEKFGLDGVYRDYQERGQISKASRSALSSFPSLGVSFDFLFILREKENPKWSVIRNTLLRSRVPKKILEKWKKWKDKEQMNIFDSEPQEFEELYNQISVAAKFSGNSSISMKKKLIFMELGIGAIFNFNGSYSDIFYQSLFFTKDLYEVVEVINLKGLWNPRSEQRQLSRHTDQDLNVPRHRSISKIREILKEWKKIEEMSNIEIFLTDRARSISEVMSSIEKLEIIPPYPKSDGISVVEGLRDFHQELKKLGIFKALVSGKITGGKILLTEIWDSNLYSIIFENCNFFDGFKLNFENDFFRSAYFCRCVFNRGFQLKLTDRRFGIIKCENRGAMIQGHRWFESGLSSGKTWVKWEDGVAYDCSFGNGIFENGEFINGHFFNSIWVKGKWKNSSWEQSSIWVEKSKENTDLANILIQEFGISNHWISIKSDHILVLSQVDPDRFAEGWKRLFSTIPTFMKNPDKQTVESAIDSITTLVPIPVEKRIELVGKFSVKELI